MTRPHHRPGWGLCGCQHPRRHEPGCGWHLDAEHRVRLAAATIVDGFPAPRLAADHECAVLARIHLDTEYARRVADWITSGRAA